MTLKTAIDPMPKSSVSFYTLGCRLNQSETATIRQTFELDGWRIVDFLEPADLVVINTCTVTEDGDADTRRLVHKVLRVNPHSRIALVGCQAQIQKEKLAKLPNVRWIVGNARKMELASILRESGVSDEFPVQVITPPIPKESFTSLVPAVDPEHTRANLKIQDGCDFFCSFCEIPYARGRARSRGFEDLLREAEALVAAGHKELVLTGINLGTYEGRSRPSADEITDERKLLDVIDALEAIEGLKRIRISSIEPTTIPEELLGRISPSSKLCRYLHVPLQSGSDRILERMKRRYTVKEFSGFVERAYRMVEGICLGTDVIVGFPGETEEDFEETYRLLRDLPLAYFHVFSYSQRHLAQSRRLPDPVNVEKIQQRSFLLRELSCRKRRLFLQGLLGTVQKVLFEQKKDDDNWEGLTDHYARVKMPSPDNLRNQFFDVYLDRLEGQVIRGHC
jgi:threonylcarbamoyladenosine tRNA methylthiotransferase MtaB